MALAFGGVAALATGLVAGPTVDRIGGRNTLLLGLALQAAAFLMFPLIRQPWEAFALLALEGAGTACFWPGQSTLLSRLTPPEDRHSAYALQRVSMNLGMGLGGVIGGLIATTQHPDSFTKLFVADAATFLVFVLVLSTIREPRPVEPRVDEARTGYGAVLRNRNFVALLGLNVLFVAVGYEVFALLPPFAKNYARRERALGRVDLAREHPVDRADPAAGLEGARGPPPDGGSRADEPALGRGIADRARGGRAADRDLGGARLHRRDDGLRVGETLQGPTQAPLVADLAPEHLRGRYFALSAMSWSAGSILGPAVGGALLGWHPLAVWPIAAAVCVVAAAGCLLLERRLPEGVRRTPKRAETVTVTALTPPLDLAPERL